MWLVEEERGSGLIPYHHSVLRIESVEIPRVGPLQCFVIQMDPLIPGSGETEMYWFSPGVGIVRAVYGAPAKNLMEDSARRILLLKAFSFSSDITIRY